MKRLFDLIDFLKRLLMERLEDFVILSLCRLFRPILVAGLAEPIFKFLGTVNQLLKLLMEILSNVGKVFHDGGVMKGWQLEWD